MSKTSSQVKNRYNKKAYDNILLVLKKGQKEIVKEHAEKQGMSVNKYINQLIERDMKQ